MDKKFWATTFTLSGAVIGAGILGLPYVFAKSGFLSGVFWIILLGIVMTFINLSLGEITLRTKGKHQISGYARIYLGKKAGTIAFFAVIFGVYSALLAYLVGEGESLSLILPGNLNPIVLGIGFWFFMTILLGGGLRELKKVESYGVIAIIGIILGLFIYHLPNISLANLAKINQSHFFLPFGVVLFAIMGFTAIPELRQEIKGKEHLFKKSLILGMAIPSILYILFSSIFVGILGKNVTEVATLSFGPLMILLGIFTMMTSFFVMSFALRDMFKYDLGMSTHKTFFFSSLFPLILYLLITGIDILGFSEILGIGGIVSGGISAIIILLTARKAKHTKRGKNEPEINIPINWPIIILLSLIFIVGSILEFVF